MIKVKAIGNNARIVGGSQAMSVEDSAHHWYFNSDLGAFVGCIYFSYDVKRYVTNFTWLLKPDGTVPTQQDAVDAGINLEEGG